MTEDEKKKLNDVVNQVAELLEQKAQIDDDIAEIVADAAEKLQLRKGNIRKAAKEMLLTETDRADKRLIEEELDQIRNALGILADTPLGEAATAASEKPKRRGRAAKAADDWDAAAPAGSA